MTTSATGGYLTTALPDNVALRRFFQGLIKGITGLPGPMVRPRWQANPPPMPSIDTNWCSFGITARAPDASAYVSPAEENARIVRHEDLEIVCSFYGPAGEGYAEILRDGMQVSQNREPLLIASMGFKSNTGLTHVPEQHNDRWYERCDITLTISRETGKVYEILCFTGAIGAIITETLTLPFEVTNP